MSYTFVNNPVYDKTNYIYSIELAKNALDDELALMHGDLVFFQEALDNALHSGAVHDRKFPQRRCRKRT